MISCVTHGRDARGGSATGGARAWQRQAARGICNAWHSLGNARACMAGRGPETEVRETGERYGSGDTMRPLAAIHVTLRDGERLRREMSRSGHASERVFLRTLLLEALDAREQRRAGQN